MSYSKGGAFSGHYWEAKMRGFLRGKVKVGGESVSMEQLAVMLNKQQGRSGYVYVGKSGSDRVYLVNASANGIFPSNYAGMGYGTPLSGLSPSGKYLVKSRWRSRSPRGNGTWRATRRAAGSSSGPRDDCGSRVLPAGSPGIRGLIRVFHRLVLYDHFSSTRFLSDS
jgi:hypothetical protein